MIIIIVQHWKWLEWNNGTVNYFLLSEWHGVCVLGGEGEQWNSENRKYGGSGGGGGGGDGGKMP